MASYYDDNFGHWDMEDEEDFKMYKRFQKTNVKKKCARCGRLVKIQPQYAYCNSCADAIEHGREF